MLSISLWRWHINISITILDIIVLSFNIWCFGDWICLGLKVEPTQLGSTERASLRLRIGRRITPGIATAVACKYANSYRKNIVYQVGYVANCKQLFSRAYAFLSAQIWTSSSCSETGQASRFEGNIAAVSPTALAPTHINGYNTVIDDELRGLLEANHRHQVWGPIILLPIGYGERSFVGGKATTYLLSRVEITLHCCDPTLCGF
jgi:hypothetical protein